MLIQWAEQSGGSTKYLLSVRWRPSRVFDQETVSGDLGSGERSDKERGALRGEEDEFDFESKKGRDESPDLFAD
jgi:hypothetical protein